MARKEDLCLLRLLPRHQGRELPCPWPRRYHLLPLLRAVCFIRVHLEQLHTSAYSVAHPAETGSSIQSKAWTSRCESDADPVTNTSITRSYNYGSQKVKMKSTGSLTFLPPKHGAYLLFCCLEARPRDLPLMNRV